MDGPWQLGHKTAYEYGRLAAQTAHAMRAMSPDIKLVACGSSNWNMSTFGSWETTVLEQTYDFVDMISCHAYYQLENGDHRSFLASGAHMDRYIDATVNLADAVGAKRRSTKRIDISFDEWNVWNSNAFAESPTPPDWIEARRLIEDDYTVTDAVVVGGLLITLLRHADRVAAACLAQLVNVIGPIRTEPRGPAWRQTSFYPFAQVARCARGDILRADPTVASHETERYGDVPIIDAIATHNQATAETTLFIVNRSLEHPVVLEVDARAVGGASIVEALSISDPDINVTNTLAEPDRVTPGRVKDATIDAGRVTMTLPPVSWTLLRVAE
jgi:alpha-N-arabinofuranosidase